MAIAEMRKVLLVGEKKFSEAVVKKLAEAGIFQPISLTPEKDSIFIAPSEVKTTSLHDTLSKIERAINFLNRFDEKKFDLGLFPSKIIVDSKECSEWIRNFKWEAVCERCSEIEVGIERMKEQINSLQEDYKNLLNWRKISFPLHKLEASKYTHFQLIVVPSEEKEILKAATKKEACYVWMLEEVNRKVYVLLTFLKEQQPAMEKIIQQVKAEKVNLQRDVAPAARIQEVRAGQNNLQKQKEKMLDEAKNLFKEKIKLMALYDHFNDTLKEKEVHGNSGVSRYTFCLQGWIKEEDIPALTTVLQAFTRVAAVTKKPVGKDTRKIPVALSNHKIFKPFEFITELYGLPRHIEIDPTPFIAPFFILFLAICLTDGGYGIILAVLAFLVPRKMQVGEGGKKLFSILFMSGLITIAVGTLTGGIFGMQLQELPAILSPLRKIALINPMQEPLIFLAIVLMIGVVHLLAGIILEMKDNLRRGNTSAAFLDQFTWIVLIIGLLLVVAPFGRSFLTGNSEGSTGQMALTMSPAQLAVFWRAIPVYSKIGLIAFMGGTVNLFAFAGRKSKNIGKRLAKGAYEVYGIIQIGADILSYSRLLALGLATSVIATVVNTIARMAGEMPIVGPIMLVIILIIGHISNLVINTLSGFIHTARLQFVEFFTKFYEGGGEKFEPFTREGKYTLVKETLK